MVWHRMAPISKADLSYMRAEEKKAKFLVDECIDGRIAKHVLGAYGFDVVDVHDVALARHSDEDVFAWAWKHKRFLLTTDMDFLDNRNFPWHSNPGIVILPKDTVGGEKLRITLAHIALCIAPYADVWSGSRVRFNDEWTLTVRNREAGRVTQRRYRFGARGPYIWKDEEPS